jgi:hypothetical protein
MAEDRWRHGVGDRVERPVNVYATRSSLWSGIVTRIYSERGSLGHWYPELYEVRWDTQAGIYGGLSAKQRRDARRTAA